MKKNISDLLDAYGDPNIELEGSTPLSPERIKVLTMNKINEHPAPGKRRITFRVMMAAAIIAALAASVFASGSAATWFQTFFAGENKRELSSEQMALIEQSAVTIDQSQTVNGYTIHVESVMNDARDIYVKLNLYAPEDVALAYEGRYFEQMALYTHDGERINCGWGLEETIDADKTDNHDEILLRFHIEAGADTAFPLSDGVRLELTNLYKVYGRPLSQKKEMMAEGTWQFDLAFGAAQEDQWEYEVIREPVPCMMVKYLTDEDTEIILTSVCLRPLTIDVVYDYPDGADLESLYWLGMKVVKKDGTSINVQPSDGKICPDGDTVTGYMSLEPSAPIVLDEVAYIQFPGGTQIPVEAD